MADRNADRARKRQTMSFDPSTMVTVHVGQGSTQRSFAAHQSFLSSRSEFFRAALSGDRWEEAQTRVVNLPEDRPDIFALYLNNVYTGKLETVHDELGNSTIMDQSACLAALQAEVADLFQLYVLGEKLMDAYAKDITIVAIFNAYKLCKKQLNARPSARHLKAVYGETPPKSPCRRLLIDLLVCLSPEELADTLQHHEESIPPEAFTDLCLALRGNNIILKRTALEAGPTAYLEATCTSENETAPNSGAISPRPSQGSRIAHQEL